MKKLMTMIAAVAMSFGLFAAAVDINPHTFDPGDASAGKYDISGDTHWGYLPGPQADDALVITDAKKLEIKTGSNALKRYFVDASNTANIPADGALYFESEINFKGQALDEIPEVEDGKLAIFALDASQIEGIDADLATTNLYLIGGFGAEGKALYQLKKTVTEDFLTTAHKVTLKIYPAALSEDGRAGFLLFIDGDLAGVKAAEPVAAEFMYEPGSDGKFDLNDPINVVEAANGYLGYAKSAFVPALQGWVKGYKFFLSLDPLPTQTMASVDFMGNAILGALTLTNIAPEYIPDDAKAVTITTDLDYTVTVGGEEVTPEDGKIFGADGDDVVITVTDNEKVQDKIVKYTATGLDVAQDGLVFTFDFAANGSINITAATKVAEITIDDVTTKYSDLTTALTDLQSADVATLKLFSSDTIDSIITAGSDVTIDLNGQTITGTGTSAGAVIYVSSGKTTVIDTATGGKVVPSDDSIKAAICEAAAELDITAGIFDGVIVANEGEPSGTISISGGSFVGEATAFPYPTWLAARKVATYDDVKYWVVGDQPSAGFVIQLVGNITQSGDAETGYTFTCANSMKMFVNGVEDTTFDGTFTPDWYETKQYVVVSEVLPAASAPEHKWFEGLGAVASNKLEWTTGGNGEGPFSGKMDDGIIVTTGGTGNSHVLAYETADLESNGADYLQLVTKSQVTEGFGDTTLSIMRGAAVSKRLNVMLAFSSTGNKLISLPLDVTPIYSGADQNAFIVTTEDENGAATIKKWEVGAFSADAQYFYAVEGRKSVSKFQVVNGLKGTGAKLVRVWTQAIDLGEGCEARSGALAKFGDDEIFYLAGCDESDTAAVKGIGVWAFNTTSKTLKQIVDDDSVIGTYGAVNVAGNTLNVFSCVNTAPAAGTDVANSKLVGYTLAADGWSVTANAYEFNLKQLEACGFGLMTQHCCEIFVSPNEETAYIGLTYTDPNATPHTKVSKLFTAKYTAPKTLTVTDDANAKTAITVDGAQATSPATVATTAKWVITATPEQGYAYTEAPAGWTLVGEVISKEAYMGIADVAITIPAPTPTAQPPVDPTKPTEVTAESAEAACAKVDMAVPAEFTELVTDQAAYFGLFTKVATPTGVDNKWNVTMELNETGTNTLKAASVVKGDSVLTPDADGNVTLVPTSVVPGFYYGVAANAEVTEVKGTTPAEWVKAGASGLQKDLKAEKPSDAKGFFVIKISPTAK